LTSSVGTSFGWTAQQNLTGSVYSPIQNSGSILKKQSLGTTLGNTTSGGADQVFSFQQGITAGSSATIDLSAMTNLLNVASVSIVRIKAYQIRILSASDDPTISPAPTATSTATVTNNGPSVPNALDFNTGGSGLTITTTVTGGALATVTIAAAGTGYPKSASFMVTVNQASGSGGVISVTTNSSGVPTAVAIVAAGTGYTGASGLPTTVLGQYTILTGGAHMYFDPAANGFATVSSTATNITILNNDGSHAITAEIDVIGCTS
ncbi:MAG: hypothetical protein KGL39_40680, partial [Patescibacteria group bacterium]|nr:hypothetical protein [Patescibacteria group bacterium]